MAFWIPSITFLPLILSYREDQAVGIEYLQDPTTHQGASVDPIIATAKKLVILSAGTFGSPTILERSGVGPGLLLKRLGIQTIVDLPGVGENYQGEDFPRLLSDFE